MFTKCCLLEGRGRGRGGEPGVRKEVLQATAHPIPSKPSGDVVWEWRIVP